jgi:hypothetical protein
MKNMFSSTAVTRTEKGNVVLATLNNGLFTLEDGKWINTLPGLNKQIRDLKSAGKVIYGAGDNGIFIRSKNDGIDWDIKQFPTKASVWSISCNTKGLVVAHGEKVIYISINYGETWKILSPFNKSNPPSIRSLCLYENYLFIGTKIHPENGGIWMHDLRTNMVKRIKVETDKMISSIVVHNNLLITASGSSRGKKGVLEFISMNSIKNKNELVWIMCCNIDSSGSFLDISAHNGI